MKKIEENIKPVPIFDCHELSINVSIGILKEMLIEEILQCQSNGFHYLQIIVGKGLHSKNNEPVLIYRVRRILNDFVNSKFIKNYVDNINNGYLIIYF